MASGRMKGSPAALVCLVLCVTFMSSLFQSVLYPHSSFLSRWMDFTEGGVILAGLGCHRSLPRE